MNLSTAVVDKLRFEPEKKPRFEAKNNTKTVAEIGKQSVSQVDTDNSVNLLSQVKPLDATEEQKTTNNDSVKVSSTIGRAASSGQLSREEAVAIYQKIASLL